MKPSPSDCLRSDDYFAIQQVISKALRLARAEYMSVNPAFRQERRTMAKRDMDDAIKALKSLEHIKICEGK